MNFQAYTLDKHDDWACIQLKVPDSEIRTPVHLCCIIDTSASMELDCKLENVKQSLQFLLDFLGPQDFISIITFSETARTILNQISVIANEKDNIRARISIVRIESNTNLSAGIIQAHECLQLDNNNITKQGILLLTDGVANTGLTSSKDILELIHNTMTKFNGTSISSIGYGTDHNAELLQTISANGGGSYYVVNNIEDVASVFGDILGGLISCIAQQVRVIIPKDTEMKSRYTCNIIDDKMEAVIGDLVASSDVAFLAKLPINTEIVLKGYDLMLHNTFEIRTSVENINDETLQINGEAHYLRFEVLTLLEESRKLMMYRYSEDTLVSQISKIDSIIEIIQSHRLIHTHTLWNILLDELNICKQGLKNPKIQDIDTPQIMTQHLGYLGRMRGLPASLSQDDSNIPFNELNRTFSNNIQREISSQLSATLSACHNSNKRIPHSPIIHPANNTLCVPELTMPPIPLIRQECYRIEE